MHCELLNKDVLVDVWKEIKDEKGDILKTVYKCSECYVEGTHGRKVFKYCDVMSDKRCLLKKYIE